jgi:hypothetical protein
LEVTVAGDTTRIHTVGEDLKLQVDKEGQERQVQLVIVVKEEKVVALVHIDGLEVEEVIMVVGLEDRRAPPGHLLEGEGDQDMLGVVFLERKLPPNTVIIIMSNALMVLVKEVKIWVIVLCTEEMVETELL